MLARAVLKNARVLLVDEATSVLDTVSERRVQDAIGRMLRRRIGARVREEPRCVGSAGPCS
jgi:ABC-type multidrug transport system fused ATPase/permease subunit